MSKRTYKNGIEIGSYLIRPLGTAAIAAVVIVIALVIVLLLRPAGTDVPAANQSTPIPSIAPTEAAETPAPTPTAEPTEAPTEAPTPIPSLRSATIRSLGEIAIETDLLKSAFDSETSTFDFAPMFEMIKDSIGNADYTVADVEGTLGDKSAMSGNGSTMRTPSALLNALKDCGVDMLTLANDHILDGSQEELTATMANITAAGMDYIGAANSQEERNTPVIKEINGIKVGFLAYTESVNGNESTLSSDAQKYAVEELRGCIKFIEEHTGEKFDWDAFAKALESYNEVTRFHLDLWEINRTDHPQVTGPTPWLYRMYTYHLHGGMDQRFNKADKRVHKLMTDAYEKRLPCSAEMRHKALVWSCPANYYTNFSNWLEQCWGIVSVMDMETHISQVIIDTSTPETMLEGVALTYQRATMRKHTKGGYRNAVDEMWRVAEEYNVDTIIMYDQISCKGMDGLQGIFDEQARERNINFIWVQQDLMDPRTISRRDMRRQVNQYMTSVLRETPVDPTLLDFDDCDAF